MHAVNMHAANKACTWTLTSMRARGHLRDGRRLLDQQDTQKQFESQQQDMRNYVRGAVGDERTRNDTKYQTKEDTAEASATAPGYSPPSASLQSVPAS